MKKITFAALLCAIMLAMPASMSAFDIKDIFGSGSVVGNIIEGVFTKTNLKLADLQGNWTVNGSAVTFKSDNLLQKAGGLAAAATVENKIDPYFKQYGLTGAVMTIDSVGNATLQLKKGVLKGTFVPVTNKDYNFEFKVKVAGISLGTLPTYVEKSYANLNIMFDATKLKNLISVVASVSGNKLAGAAGEILNQYEGLCVGFKMSGTSGSSSSNNAVSNSSSSSSTQTGNKQTSDSTANTNSDTVSSGLGKLIDIFKRK